MLKAKVENGKLDVELEGRITEILADLTVLSKSIFKELEEKTGMPADFHRTTFIIGLKVL